MHAFVCNRGVPINLCKPLQFLSVYSRAVFPFTLSRHNRLGKQFPILRSMNRFVQVADVTPVTF